MTALNELYQEMILDHNKNPRNFHKLGDGTCHAEGYNPLCGDHYNVYVALEGDVIKEVGFEGNGCAISKASGSMMTLGVKGKTKTEAKRLFDLFHKMVTGDTKDPVPPELGKLAVFSGVCEFPSRVKCASLAWHTLLAALEGKSETVSTEKDEKKEEKKSSGGLDLKVIDVLRTCYDPEIPVNIHELGLIYDIDVVPPGDVNIKMTLTSPACPVAGSLPPEVQRKVSEIPGVNSVKVDLVWDPPWSPAKMSEAAKLKLGMF